MKILTELMHEEEKMDEVVKARIASQKRTIPEGTGESRLFRARQELKERLKAYL